MGEDERRKRKIVGFEDPEFRKLFAQAIIDIGYCEMYPDAPWCQRDEDEFEEDCDWYVEDGEAVE